MLKLSIVYEGCILVSFGSQKRPIVFDVINTSYCFIYTLINNRCIVKFCHPKNDNRYRLSFLCAVIEVCCHVTSISTSSVRY